MKKEQENKLRIKGVPENNEMENLKSSVETLFRDLLRKDENSLILINRAHKTLPPLKIIRNRVDPFHCPGANI